MSSLHTIYRPSSLEEVIGQPSIVKSLRKVVTDGRAHAFMFTGPAGTGKTTLARVLAQMFAKGQGTAANCEEFDAATKSGANDVREVISRTHYRAIGSSPVKAIIVDECHRLSSAAWTVFLKATEEPPKHVYWMFCSTDPEKIPKANQTRFLRYDLKPVPEDDIFSLLVQVCEAEKFDTGDEILSAIAEAAGGSPRQALVFLEKCLYCESVTEAKQHMKSAADRKEINDLCQFLIKGRGHTWTEATKYIKALDGMVDAESARIIIVNYLTAVLLNTKDDKRALALLVLMECFKTPYPASDKMGPLAYSIGMAINLDQ